MIAQRFAQGKACGEHRGAAAWLAPARDEHAVASCGSLDQR